MQTRYKLLTDEDIKHSPLFQRDTFMEIMQEVTAPPGHQPPWIVYNIYQVIIGNNGEWSYILDFHTSNKSTFVLEFERRKMLINYLWIELNEQGNDIELYFIQHDARPKRHKTIAPQRPEKKKRLQFIQRILNRL